MILSHLKNNTKSVNIIMINPSQIHITGNWSLTSENFLLDKTTNQAYPEITEKSMRAKSGMLAVSTPFAHLALSVANIGLRVLRIVTFYHFWKEDHNEKEYNFQARALETGKDFLRAIGQPFAFVALEIVSLIGLFKPYDAMRAYFHIENMFYGNPIMAELLNFVPTDYISSEEDPLPTVSADVQEEEFSDDTDFITSDSEDSLELNPVLRSSSGGRIPIDQPPLHIGEPPEHDAPLASPTLKKRISDLIEEDDKLPPSNPRTTNKCMEAIAEHFIDSYHGDDFAAWLTETKKAVKEQANWFALKLLRDDTIIKHIAEKLVLKALESGSSTPFQRCEDIPEIKEAISVALTAQIAPLNLNDDLDKFIEDYKKLNALFSQMPEVPEEFKVMQGKIALQYINLFNPLLHYRTAREPIEFFTKLESLVVLFSKEDQEEILINLLENKLSYDGSSNFDSDAVSAGLLAALKTARDYVSEDDILSNFVKKTNVVLDQLAEGEVTTPSQKYFQIQLRVLLEKEAEAIHEPLQQIEFDLGTPEQSLLNNGIKEAVARINATFSLDIEVKINMKTEFDQLSTALNTVFADQAEEIRGWIETRPGTYDLGGFEAWLLANQFYQTIPVLWEDDMPENAEALYLRYMQQL